MISFTAEEIAELENCKSMMKNLNYTNRCDLLSEIMAKIDMINESKSVDTDVEALLEVEGYAVRQHPRYKMNLMTLNIISDALKSFKYITFDYENLSTFSHPYYDLWASATFQFDTGALIPGDWTHVVMLASYTTTYSAIAGLDSDAIYIWQNSKNKVRGLSYEFQGILAYQMPLVLYRAGLMYKMNGYYDGSNYGIYDDNFDGTFAEISISPLAQLKFGEKDELAVLVDFSSRRSFDAEISKESESLLRNTLGREWFFKRLALSWTHRFI